MLRRREFQFHTGSIKRAVSAVAGALYLKFQFHNGAIKSIVSVMIVCIAASFQFHNGAIKSAQMWLEDAVRI